MRGGLRALLGVLLAVSAAAPAMAGPLPDQDDAGSGGDAPDEFEAGLRIQPGTVEGELRPVLFSTGPDPVDWYRIHVREGQRIVVAATPTTATAANEIPEVEIVDPAMNPTREEFGFDDNRSTTVVADRAGWWGLAVRADVSEQPLGYRVTVEVTSSNAADAVQRGPGYLAVDLRLGDDADLEGSLSASTSGGDWVAIHEIHDGSTTGAILLRSFGPNRAEATVSDVGGGVDVEGEGPEGSQGYKSVTKDLDEQFLSGPGNYRFIAYTRSESSHLQFVLDRADNVTVLGTETGAESAVVARHAGEFEGGVAADAGMARVAAGAHTDVHAPDGLAAFYLCPSAETGHVPPHQIARASCRVEAPDGSTSTVEDATAFVGDPGTWTFHRDREVAAGHPGLVLVGVEGALPG